MRNLFALAFVVLAGCYSPNVGSPGFFCHATDNPACPDGQACINSRCIDVASNAVVITDMAGTDGGACKAKGVACSKSVECCSFTCSPTDGCIDMACTQLGLACTESSKCCSNSCSPSGACQMPIGMCSANGVGCLDASTCCSTFCSSFGQCAAKTTTCGMSGDFCTSPTDCCNQQCDTTFDQCF